MDKYEGKIKNPSTSNHNSYRNLNLICTVISDVRGRGLMLRVQPVSEQQMLKLCTFQTK
ncbi:hypothetical protein LINPERPRIM_LOCUS35361 [Linum perenne]